MEHVDFCYWVNHLPGEPLTFVFTGIKGLSQTRSLEGSVHILFCPWSVVEGQVDLYH